MSVRKLFCRDTFGARLATILDVLYAFQSTYHRVNFIHEPHRGLFAEPDGDSFFEADQLTRYYYLNPREIDFALFEDKVAGARDGCSRTLVREARSMLAAQYQRSSQV